MIGILLAGCLSFGLTLLFAPLCKRLALNGGLVAHPHADRWHRATVPLLGGVAIAAATWLTTGLWQIDERQLLIVLGGASTLFVVGLVDDFKPLKPQTKFVAQILVAAAMVALGLQLRLSGHAPVNVLLTLVWIVGITNAFNLLDNMDGLAAGIAAIALSFRATLFAMDGNLEAATLTVIIVGACLAFLIHNFNPASMFMGDAGSLFLGFLVGGLSLAGTWPYSRSTFSILLFPVLTLLVPIFDTAFVMAARTLAGRPVSIGGRDHPSHRLVASGLTERQAVLLLYGVALGSGALAYYGYRFGLPASIVLIMLLGLGVALLGVYLGRIKVYPEGEAALQDERPFLRLVANFSYKRQVGMVLVDTLLIGLAYFAAYRLRFEGSYAAEEQRFVASLPIVLVCQLAAFALLRIYQGVWRYTALSDLIRLVQGVTLGTAAAVVALVLLQRFEGYSRAVFVLDWMLLLLFVSASRLSFRVFSELFRGQQAGLRRVLIYGGGDGGVMALREMFNNPVLGRSPVGFIDDDRSKQRTVIHGVPVFGGLDDLAGIADRLGVEEVVIATVKVQPERLEQLAAICEERGITIARAHLHFEDLTTVSRP
jgi:UDP-GlcNAc:undecaprenyl-phosphate GlcNAc-1-phosphate transferase